MQPLETPFRDEITNFSPPDTEPSLFQFSFILDARTTQPIIVYQTAPTRGFSRLRRVILRPDLEAELADYVAKMAGTEFDLDPSLEAASIERILSLSDDE
jgi:hypothetical protein